MKQIGIDQVKQLGSQLENLNSAIDANDNSIIELNTAIETNSNSIVELNTAVEETNNSIIELNNVLEGKQDTLIAGTGITIENNVISLNGGSSKSALQVTCSYNDDVLKGVAVVVNETTITTKSNGLATFTGLDSGTKSIVASKDGFVTNTSSKVVENPFETVDVVMQPITLTFTITNSANVPISGATITVGTYSATTNNEGIAVISEILDGTYTYTISALTYETVTGTIIINRNNESESIVMLTAPINCYAAEAVTVDNAVKLNAGMGSADVDYNVYAANTSVINVLTLDGLARSSASVGETAEVRVTDYQEQVITITTDQDNADIEFNNGNDINQATINLNPIIVRQKYLAFVKTDNSVIYFKGSVTPFSAGGNAVNNTQFTYYTYANGVMTSHLATTATTGNSNYQDNILTIYSATEVVNGVFTRTPESDVITEISEDLSDATITTSGYLTTPQAVIPRNNYWNFSVEKVNPEQWKMFFIVGGSYLDLSNLSQIVVPNNTLVKIWGFRADKASSPQVTQYVYYRTFTITNDRTFRKIKFFITDPAEQNFDVVITVNNVPFEFTGACNIEAYAGDVINWTVSKSGYITQTGSYTVPDYPLPTSNYEQIQSVTLVANTVTLTITDGTNNLSGVTVIISENTYTSDNTGKIIISNMNNGIHNYTASLTSYPTVTGSFTVAGANLTQTIALAEGEVTFTVTNSSSTPLENVLIALNGNSYRTDSNGQVTISNVDYGIQNYTVFLNGYAKKTGDTVNVNAATITKTVTLVANYNN
jgi:hypothetical protein